MRGVALDLFVAYLNTYSSSVNFCFILSIGPYSTPLPTILSIRVSERRGEEGE
jgi:hypothetical protein